MTRISLGVCLLLLVASSTVYEVQGTFLLRHYLRKFPRRSNDFRPFACKGMLKFIEVLEPRCPLKPEYKNFFGKLRSFMGFISSASGSTNFDAELKGQAEGLHNAMTSMGGKSGSADSSKVMDVLLSMGNTLGQTQRSGSTIMSFRQRRELIMSMAKWAGTIGQFVASTALKSGASVDISSLGLDGIDASADAGGPPTPSGPSGTDTRGSTSTGSSTNVGASTNTGYGTSVGASTNTGYGTSVGASTNTGYGTSVGASTNTGSGTTYGASTTTGGGSTTTGGSSISTGGGSKCVTSACSSGGGGGTSYQGSINYQQQSGAKNSQQTTTTTN